MLKAGKVPKFLSHRLFRSSRYSIWLDSKMQLHYTRHCVWEEFDPSNLNTPFPSYVPEEHDRQEYVAHLRRYDLLLL
ncbi:hypothetical protein LOK49_Contig19G00001 [Camellia lanceoleosa]|nr:hypothetical protein LOK49_Contig19G00001 [Camellia lanceoleosa]